MKKKKPRLDSGKKYCLDCDRIEVRYELSGKPIYWCTNRDKDVTKTILWKRACKDYSPI